MKELQDSQINFNTSIKQLGGVYKTKNQQITGAEVNKISLCFTRYRDRYWLVQR